jgi:hypothetical protein
MLGAALWLGDFMVQSSARLNYSWFDSEVHIHYIHLIKNIA